MTTFADIPLLSDLRADIRKEVRYLDKKPYSHNIISLALALIEEHWGQSEANKAIVDFKLDRKGWRKRTKP